MGAAPDKKLIDQADKELEKILETRPRYMDGELVKVGDVCEYVDPRGQHACFPCLIRTALSALRIKAILGLRLVELGQKPRLCVPRELEPQTCLRLVKRI